MAIPQTYAGMPVMKATPEVIRHAVMRGRLLVRNQSFAAYQDGNKIVLIDQEDALGGVQKKD